MKYCSHCGKAVDDDAAFCLNCGCRIEEKQKAPSPVGQLKTNRSLLKFILLSLITFGIYGIVVMSNVSSDINTIASRYDGKKNHALLLGAVHLFLADVRHCSTCLGS